MKIGRCGGASAQPRDRKEAAKVDLSRHRQGATKSVLSGERGRNRTFNLLIKSQLLCQLSYAPDAVGTAKMKLF
jgi:hypothetical protein